MGSLIDKSKFIGAIEKGLEKGGFGVINRMKSDAAKDTGNLRGEIGQELNGTTLTIRSGAEYSSALEFGTGIHNTKGDGRKTPWVVTTDGGQTYFTTSGQEAQPFFEDNFNEGKETISAQIKSSLRGEFGK